MTKNSDVRHIELHLFDVLEKSFAFIINIQIQHRSSKFVDFILCKKLNWQWMFSWVVHYSSIETKGH